MNDQEMENAGFDANRANMLEAAAKQQEQAETQAPHKSIFQTMAEKFGFGKKAGPQIIEQASATPTPTETPIPTPTETLAPTPTPTETPTPAETQTPIPPPAYPTQP